MYSLNLRAARLAGASALALAAALFTASASTALAHGLTQVGDYDLEIGFRNEPAVQGEINSLDLVVINHKTTRRINGLEETLHAEIVFGGQRRALPVYAREGEDGAYGADVILTRQGDYTWHIWGDIKDQPVDVTMTSSPETFSSVQSKSAFSFPDAEMDVHEVQSAAQTALIVGIAGVALGLAGSVLGIIGLRASRTK